MEELKQEESLMSLSFEKALNDLENIVGALEEGRTDLDQAITLYEQGILLKKHCEKKLKEAKMRVDQITLNKDGTVDGTTINGQSDVCV